MNQTEWCTRKELRVHKGINLAFAEEEMGQRIKKTQLSIFQEPCGIGKTAFLFYVEVDPGGERWYGKWGSVCLSCQILEFDTGYGAEGALRRLLMRARNKWRSASKTLPYHIENSSNIVVSV